MDKKYLLIGGIAIFAAWWFFFRNTETEDPDTADDQPEEEGTTTANVIPGTSLRGSRTTAGLTQPNRSGRSKGTTNNRRSGEAAITYEPTILHYELPIYSPNNN